MTLYRDILKKAWKVVKCSKNLWFFGLFVAPLANGGVFELLYRSITLEPLQTKNIAVAFLNDLSRFSLIDSVVVLVRTILSGQEGQGAPLLLLTLVAIGSVVLAWLTIVSLDALVSGAKRSLGGDAPTIREGLVIGHTSFWNIAAVVAVGMIVINFVFTFIRAVLSINIGIAYPWTTIAEIAAFVILLAAIVFVYFIAFYTIAFIVLKRAPIRSALSQGYELFMRYWLVNIELSALLFVLTLVAGLLGTAVIKLFAELPLSYLVYLGTASRLLPASVAVSYILQTVVALLMMLLWAMISVFQLASWTALFGQLTKKTVAVESKTVRVGRIIGSMITPARQRDVLE